VLHFVCELSSSIFGFYHPGGVFHPRATNNGQFDGFGWLTAGKLTDRSEGTPVPELVEGPSPPWSTSLMRGPFLAFNIHGFPAFAWNDGTGAVCPPRALVTFTSRHRHLRVCGGPVFLLPLLILHSVSLLLSFPCFSVLIRGKCFCLFFLPWIVFRFCLFFLSWLIFCFCCLFISHNAKTSAPSNAVPGVLFSPKLHQFYLMPSRNLAFRLQLDLKNNLPNSDNCYNLKQSRWSGLTIRVVFCCFSNAFF
jgi:hypothetical protein